MNNQNPFILQEKMNVEAFNSILHEQLKSHKYQYDRHDEGKVYLGFPDFDFSNFTKDERAYFIYYLCLFVAFDLLVYSYDNPNYLKQKNELNIPKLEYGLTNTFVFPNRLYDHYRPPFNAEIFKDVYRLGLNYLNSKISDLQPIKMFELALNDKNFSSGMFSHALKNEIKSTNDSAV